MSRIRARRVIFSPAFIMPLAVPLLLHRYVGLPHPCAQGSLYLLLDLRNGETIGSETEGSVSEPLRFGGGEVVFENAVVG
ncbi:MAG: hypothetical protein MUO76_03615 [Anaerolineaceae bacterium]|nr:hypothetical protein [Anaerolineaceae bacterium]